MKIEVSIVGGLCIGAHQPTGESVAQETDRRWFAELPDGAIVRDLIKQIGLPNEDISLVLVNGHHSDRRTLLHDGDAVAFAGEMTGD